MPVCRGKINQNKRIWILVTEREVLKIFFLYHNIQKCSAHVSSKRLSNQNANTFLSFLNHNWVQNRFNFKISDFAASKEMSAQHVDKLDLNTTCECEILRQFNGKLQTRFNNSLDWIFSAREPSVICDLVEVEHPSTAHVTGISPVESRIPVTSTRVERNGIPVRKVHANHIVRLNLRQETTW